MRRPLACSALAVLLLATASPAWAQSDTRMLYDRIDRLERDMAILQSQGGRGGNLVVRSQALGGGVTSSGAEPALSGGQSQRLEDRIDALEDMMRQLTGKVEEANFKADKVARQAERMQADIELRFKEMQDSARTASSAPPPAGAMSMPAASAPSTTPGGAPVLTPPRGAVVSDPAAGAHVLGQLSDKDQRKAPPPAPKDPKDAYDDAYGLAQKGDYDGAERAFQTFVKDNPTHQLAGNALFWLGDIAYSQRKDFAQAAQLFADGYKRFPKHPKAPDMLFKLGQSFAQLDKKTEACKVYSLLSETHPDMPDRIKRTVTADRQRLNCK